MSTKEEIRFLVELCIRSADKVSEEYTHNYNRLRFLMRREERSLKLFKVDDALYVVRITPMATIFFTQVEVE